MLTDFFASKNLDIRKNGNNPRFLDQKCTPDVVSFIADCILQLSKQSFQRNDIWQHNYFVKNATFIFGKPSPNNHKAAHEYDKVILQPLDMLAYAGILEKRKNNRRKNIFILKEKSILEFISINEMNAFHFLYVYLDKFARDSSFYSYVSDFLKKQNADSFNILKDKFIKFLLANSQIGTRGSKNNGTVEIKRIFSKFINVFAVYYRKQGTEKGHLSKGIFLMSDLMYNRLNFRDIKKLKNITRQEQKQAKYSKPAVNRKFLMQKAIKWVKQHHKYSEVFDKYHGQTAQIHHIFPKNKFPMISYYIENLIALTAGQHADYAHPNSNTNKINLQYQKICLHAKHNTINSELANGETPYNIFNFMFVLKTGFQDKNIDVPINSTNSDITKIIDTYYLP
jgi:hypothetical protein